MAERIENLENLQIPREISEEASKIYEKIKNERFPKKEKFEAALFVACEKHSCGMVRKLPSPKLKLVSRIRKEMGIKPNIEPIDRVDSVCRSVNRGENISSTAKKILKRYREMYPSDYYARRPLTMAVAAVYIAGKLCGDEISQLDLWEVSGVTPVSIRKGYREMVDKLNIKFDGSPYERIFENE